MGESEGTSAVAAVASPVVPESVTESVNKTLASIEELKPQILELLSLCDPDVLSILPPLQRAKALFLLAEATTTLFTLRLRCTGVHPDDHHVKSEIERLSLYREKLQRSMDRSKEPLRPATVLNRQAATRVIKHSLPDLTPAQRQSMRNLGKGERCRTKYSETSGKKRKYQSNEKQSVQASAKEFLEKASRELLGSNENGLKGPLMAVTDGSDEDMA